jgi:hypothetical protein
MPYFRAPAERPRQAKRFLTSREVEDMAADGRTEIVHQDDMVITDAARETAHDLGVRIVKPDANAPARPAAPASDLAAVQALAPGTATAAPSTRAAGVSAQSITTSGYAPGSTDPLVHAIVQAMRARKG